MDSKLEELERSYEILQEKLASHCKRIQELLEDEKVKEYVTLTSEYKQLERDLERLQIKRMENCKHIFVIGEIVKDFDGHRTDKNPTHYCVKCGLDTTYEVNDVRRDLLPDVKRAMGRIYFETRKNATFIEKVCEPELAKQIYQSLRDRNPDISEELLAEFLKTTLENKEEVQKVKQLSLSTNN